MSRFCDMTIVTPIEVRCASLSTRQQDIVKSSSKHSCQHKCMPTPPTISWLCHEAAALLSIREWSFAPSPGLLQVSIATACAGFLAHCVAQHCLTSSWHRQAAAWLIGPTCHVAIATP
eukprot:5985580-Amphidinium_carterae.1